VLAKSTCSCILQETRLYHAAILKCLFAGEETEVTGIACLHSPTSYSSWSSKHSKGGSSPVLTPRRSSLAYSASGVAGKTFMVDIIASRCFRKMKRLSVMSVRMEQLGFCWTDFNGILYLRIFQKSVKKV